MEGESLGPLHAHVSNPRFLCIALIHVQYMFMYIVHGTCTVQYMYMYECLLTWELYDPLGDGWYLKSKIRELPILMHSHITLHTHVQCTNMYMYVDV